MNQTPDQNRNQYSDQQNSSPRNSGANQNAGRNTYPQKQGNGGNTPGSNMTPEQREEYLRRLEARRRAQERRGGSRSGYRRRKRVGINIGITIFLVLICLVLGVSFYQIFQNTNPSSGNKDPQQNVQDTGNAAETEGPVETVDPAETSAPETDPPETEPKEDPNALFDTYPVNSADINLGDLILVNYQYAYSLADTVAVKTVYGNKPNTYGLSTTAHCLTERTLNALNKLADGFVADTGCYELIVNSAYRNTESQQSIYDRNVQQNGEEYAKQYVANPGYSEHHTGMAVDLTFYQAAIGATVPVAQHPNGSWLTEHCAEYGFIIRYPDDKANITKISYEPWHFRFVGKPHAAIIMKTGLCFEEYLGLMKNYTLDTKLLHALEDGTTAEVNVISIPTEGYVIYYVPASEGETTEIKIPKGYEHYIVSGNNVDGFIVTVYVGQ